MSNKAVIFLEEGFEEVEALASVDILRRGGVDIVIAGVSEYVSGSHNITIKSDVLTSSINSADYDAFILPGGMPGALNLKNNSQVIKLLQEGYNSSKIVAAICASPLVLDAAGVLKGKNFTMYPSMQDQAPSGIYDSSSKVVIDGNIITGCGPVAAFEFALAVLKSLKGQDTADNVAKGMLLL